MATILPFRAWRYQWARAGAPEDLITPPYDVISPSQREALARRSRHNFVHLILPEAGSGEDRHQAAARAYHAWRDAGILVQDASPQVTIHAQTYVTTSGETRRRAGLLALLELPDGAAGILPHERTLAGPRADRLRLMLSVRAHLSPIFLLAPDPDGAFDALLEGALARHHDPLDFTDAQGVRHAIAEDPGEAFLREASSRLAGRNLIIADGHHRFESARACHLELARLHGSTHPLVRESARVLVHVVSMASSGLTILPIHRTVSPPGPWDPSTLLVRLRRRFRIDEIPHAAEPRLEAREDLRRLLERGGTGTIGMAIAGLTGYYVLHAGPRPASEDPRDALDVMILHRDILAGELGIAEGEVERGKGIEFTHDWHAALDAVQGRRAGLAFLLNPTPLADVARITAAGLILPQKSTFFHPKVPAGIVIHGFN